MFPMRKLLIDIVHLSCVILRMMYTLLSRSLVGMFIKLFTPCKSLLALDGGGMILSSLILLIVY